MIATADVASDSGSVLINDCAHHGRKGGGGGCRVGGGGGGFREGGNPLVHHPLSECREEIGY